MTLVEKEARLGGQLLAATKVDEKSEEIRALIRYFETLLKKHGVDIRLSTEVTGPSNLPIKSEAVVLAVGAEPRQPDFAASERVLTVMDLLMDRRDTVGNRIVVIAPAGPGSIRRCYLMQRRDAR